MLFLLLIAKKLVAASGRFPPLVSGSLELIYTCQAWPVDWSRPMQATGQVECKWVVNYSL